VVTVVKESADLVEPDPDAAAAARLQAAAQGAGAAPRSTEHDEEGAELVLISFFLLLAGNQVEVTLARAFRNIEISSFFFSRFFLDSFFFFLEALSQDGLFSLLQLFSLPNACAFTDLVLPKSIHG
jgi:hypothetical protein